jgi:vancomycin resistance protein YoaR
VPDLHLLGSPFPLAGDAIPRALDRVRRYAAGKFSIELPDGSRRPYALGRLGAEIDKLRLTQLVRDARDATSPLRRAWHGSGAEGPLKLPVPIALNPEMAVPELLKLKDELDRAPLDARLDLEKRVLVKEVDGRLLDVDASLASVEAALARGEQSAPLVFEIRKPKRVAEKLGNVQFDAVLGHFETRYNRGDRYQARTYNLRLAASKLDGVVLLPGEVFDFNEVVGPRDEANGYKVAPVIAEGELVDGIGGGTCQISGTLHGAAFFAGLEITERYPHTRPSSYIKMGLDATVVYPTINFRIRNGFDFPVVLHQTVKNGVVRAEILGPKREHTVTLIRKIDEAIPYEEVERPDPDLPNGLRVLAQRGIAGFKLHRYRIVREGAHAVRERWNDVYPPTAQIIRVGSGPVPKDLPDVEDDPHPEYVADELLIVTQGPAAEGDVEERPSDADGTLREWRERGKYGEAGWTQRAGMPYFRTRHEDRASETEDASEKRKQTKKRDS